MPDIQIFTTKYNFIRFHQILALITPTGSRKEMPSSCLSAIWYFLSVGLMPYRATVSSFCSTISHQCAIILAMLSGFPFPVFNCSFTSEASIIVLPVPVGICTNTEFSCSQSSRTCRLMSSW